MSEDTIYRQYWENGELEKWHLDCDVIFDESLVREFWDHILNFRKAAFAFDDDAVRGVFANKQFSEDFLREIIERWTWNSKWNIISQTQRLSERFIEEYKDEWDWDKVFMYQTVSKNFIRKYKEKISDYVMNETDIGTYL